jgi:hypothetical protein
VEWLRVETPRELQEIGFGQGQGTAGVTVAWFKVIKHAHGEFPFVNMMFVYDGMYLD